jgi:hypothetical protein
MIGATELFERIMIILLEFAILALIIERSLYQVFDSKLWAVIEKRLDEIFGKYNMDLKPWVAIAISIATVHIMELDMIRKIFIKGYIEGDTRALTKVLTGLFIAGGSTGVFKFFKRLRKLREIT